MFMGEYNHTVDEKGRLIMPAKYREQLGDTFFVTQGFDGCLYVYPQSEWANIEENLRKLPSMKRGARDLTRRFLGHAAELEIDKQGRVLLPAKLRSLANIKKDVVLVGVLDKIEIWDKEKWESNMTYTDEDMEEIANEMADLGFNL